MSFDSFLYSRRDAFHTYTDEEDSIVFDSFSYSRRDAYYTVEEALVELIYFKLTFVSFVVIQVAGSVLFPNCNCFSSSMDCFSMEEKTRRLYY